MSQHEEGSGNLHRCRACHGAGVIYTGWESSEVCRVCRGKCRITTERAVEWLLDQVEDLLDP